MKPNPDLELEKTTTTIIQTPTIKDEELEEIILTEKENKILYTTLLISCIIYLFTIIAW